MQNSGLLPDSTRAKMTGQQAAILDEMLSTPGTSMPYFSNRDGIVRVTLVTIDGEERFELEPGGGVRGVDVALVPSGTEQRLTEMEHALAVIFTPEASLEEGTQGFIDLARSIAETRIQKQEKDARKDGYVLPWQNGEASERSAAIRDYEQVTTAAAITQRVQRIAGMAGLHWVIEAENTNIGWTTPDGTYETVEEALNARWSELGEHRKTSGSARQAVRFVKEAVPECVRVGVDPALVLPVAQNGMGQLRETGKAIMQAREQGGSDEQLKAKYEDILKFAAQASSAEEIRLQYRRNPRGLIRTHIEHGPDPRVVMACNEEQIVDVLLPRMRGALEFDDNLVLPITTEVISHTEYALLIRLSELQNPVKRYIMGMLEHTPDQVGLQYLLSASTEVSERQVLVALGELEHWGLVQATVDATGERKWQR